LAVVRKEVLYLWLPKSREPFLTHSIFQQKNRDAKKNSPKFNEGREDRSGDINKAT
jgi:hypothetical protein